MMLKMRRRKGRVVVIDCGTGTDRRFFGDGRDLDLDQFILNLDKPWI